MGFHVAALLYSITPILPNDKDLLRLEMNSDVRSQVEDFYYLEAELLDERKLREWLALFSDDVRYWMPVRHNLSGRPADIMEELAQPHEAYYFDDNKENLRLRVERVYSKTAWSELPPSRTRHFVTNIRVEPTGQPDEYRVRSNVLVYRSYGDQAEYNLLTADRRDVLRRTSDGWEIARRTVILDQPTLATHNLSFFF